MHQGWPSPAAALARAHLLHWSPAFAGRKGDLVRERRGCSGRWLSGIIERVAPLGPLACWLLWMQQAGMPSDAFLGTKTACVGIVFRLNMKELRYAHIKALEENATLDVYT